ncbi:hypothetical protein NW754_016586 [Fusarium falciforme]|uniref:Cytochrome c oxidase assembly factor 3 n=1 Tax=Fusarium falciforme TaxID=195108 RepID=A0A9W8UZV3_9HYPO|nr:hypothetical protein NW754_016586 [Fusarium falciforme]KAJ4184203.1 hypothetical protein NW755_009209 [Fusarium falciforme]
MPPSPQSTYYDRRLRQGPALVRARRPYLFKNAVTGLGLLTVVGAICTTSRLHVTATRLHCLDYYTLNAVGQDNFEDVKVPDEPRKPASSK